MSISLKIITPEKTVFDSEVKSIYLETDSGQIGILENHADFMTKVKPGEIRLESNGKQIRMASGEGILQMQDNQVIILTDLAEDESIIDEKLAEIAKQRAEDALEQKLSSEEYVETLAILERSLAKLKVKRKHH